MNQNPEQIARDKVDQLLTQSGWIVQPKSKLNLAAGLGIAVTEYRTDTGPVGYLLSIDRKPIGVIEAKKAEEGVRLTTVEDQSLRYTEGKLKHFEKVPLLFAYESTGEVTRFTNYRDPKPRSRPVFTFHRPEAFAKWIKEDKKIRARLHDIPGLPTDGLRDCQITAITNLETSFKENRPKALIQMATGSGKTFTKKYLPRDERHSALIEEAAKVFNDYELRNYVIDVRRKYDQTIDHISPDEILKMGWVKDSVAGAQAMILEFKAWIEAHKNEIIALQIFYGQPYRRRELTYKMIDDLHERPTQEKPAMKLDKLWEAFATEEDEDAKGKLIQRLPRAEKPRKELILLVSILRKAVELDEWLNAYDKTVDKNFQNCFFRKQAGSLKFTEEQMQWLRLIKDYVANSFHISKDDFDLSPFNSKGGLGKFY